MSRPTMTDRKRGALLGLAVGDALGAAVEFEPPGEFPPVTGYRAGGPHGLGPGEWTDDTSMALALADSLGQAGWDLSDQAQRYVRWWRQGAYSVNGRCFDIGITTRAALASFQQHGDPRTSGNSAEHASGNGSIMRLAPVPIRFAELFPDHVDELAARAAESSLPTHASWPCLSACRYLAVVLAGLMHGLPREEVLAADWAPLARLRQAHALHPAMDEVAAGSFRRRKPSEIQGSGYVVKSLEAALWAFHDAADFREAVLRAVNLGDDADTTGAVCGQLAGAFWGESGIPREWLDGLAKREMMENALAGLLGPQGTTATIATSPRFELAAGVDAPLDRCYWVVPGKFLAGAYPGARDVDEHRRRVEAIWQTGVRTFLNLMEEDETDHYGQPFAPYDDIVRELAVKHGGPISCLRFPVRDLNVPSAPMMRSILDAIDLSLAAERPLYLHCWGGVGRTGTAVGCWLLRHRHATPESVLDLLHQLRQADQQARHRPAPEREVQEAFVKAWVG